MKSLENLQLGQDDQHIRLADRVENQSASLALASQARRCIEIFSWNLEPDLYDAPPFIDALQKLALSHRKAQIRILIQDTTKAVKQGHRLIYLAQRIPSKIQVRKPSNEYSDFQQSFLIADAIGIIRRPMHERFEGELNFKDSIHAKQQLNFFNKVWGEAETAPYLKRLHI